MVRQRHISCCSATIKFYSVPFFRVLPKGVKNLNAGRIVSGKCWLPVARELWLHVSTVLPRNRSLPGMLLMVHSWRVSFRPVLELRNDSHHPLVSPRCPALGWRLTIVSVDGGLPNQEMMFLCQEPGIKVTHKMWCLHRACSVETFLVRASLQHALLYV